MANERKFSLRAQLSLSIALIVLLTVALTSVLANVLIGRQFGQYVNDQQSKRIADIVDSLEVRYDPHTGWNETLVHAAGMYALYNGYIVKVYDAAGKSVWDAENHDMSLCSSIMEEINERMRKWHAEGGGQMVTESYALVNAGKTVGSVSIRHYGPYFFTESDSEFLDTLNTALQITAFAALLLAFGAGALLAARIARPIRRAAEVAAQIAKGDYQIRLEGRTGNRELSDLMGSVNALAKTLGEQEALRRRLTADVAHELRTPLAAVGAHLEAMADGVWAPTAERLAGCQEEIARLSGLVSDLEQLASAESGSMALSFQKVDLAALAVATGRSFELELDRKHLEYAVEGSAEAWGDPMRLAQVLTNLISNAVKYTGEGGHIRVCLNREGETAVVAVEDDGIGIPEASRPLVFERFYRVDASRNRKTGGTGVGLAVVRSIVEAHGGSVAVIGAAPRGSRFIVRLPACPRE